MPRTLREVVFVDGVRTPFGKAGEKGMYAQTRADDLVISCIRELMRRNPGLPPERVEEVAVAATTQIGDQGLTLGRMASLLAGLPKTTPGYSVDRMCAGAMTAVTTTASSIAFGAIDVAIAGGVEHMGRHPMGEGVDPNPRIVAEKLVDPSALVMGKTAENLHDRFPHLTKERSDAFAVGSQDKLAKAYANNQIQPDLVPVATRHQELGFGLATADEPPRPGTTLEDLAALKTPFRPHGNVTAGNSAGLNDGATACVLASAEAAEELGLPVRMRLVDYAFVGVEPEVMGIGPVPAAEKALKKAGLSIEDMGLFELNEAFAVQVIAFLDHFGIADDDPRVNQYGGAIAVGHPLASSGVRLMTQLARQFEEHPEVRYGMTAMCIGIGMGAAVIWENPHHADYGQEVAACASRGTPSTRSSPAPRCATSPCRAARAPWRSSPSTTASTTPSPTRSDRRPSPVCSTQWPGCASAPRPASSRRSASPASPSSSPWAPTSRPSPRRPAASRPSRSPGPGMPRSAPSWTCRCRRSRSSTARRWVAGWRSPWRATTARSRLACPLWLCPRRSSAWCPDGAVATSCPTSWVPRTPSRSSSRTR